MIEPSRDQIRAWLLEILEKSGETPTALARRAGVAQSTLTRFLNNEHSNMLGTRTIAKIAHAARSEPIAGHPIRMHIEMPAQFSEGDATPYAIDEGSPLEAAIAVLIGERHATDPWLIKNRVLEDAGVMPGDIAIVDLSEPAKPRDVVCAQSYRWAEGRAETLFRIYEPPYLVSATRDPDLRRPLLVDNERVVIKGVVIWLVRARG